MLECRCIHVSACIHTPIPTFAGLTSAGFHSVNAAMFELARGDRESGMVAYAGLQDRLFELEEEHGYRAVKHQSFVGAGYFDDLTQVITGDLSSTTVMEGSTEQDQFEEDTPDCVDLEHQRRAG